MCEGHKRKSLFFKKYLFAGLVIHTININGMNKINKQKQIINFIKYNKIDILLVQEHNIRGPGAICTELSDFCFISMNYANCLKGGTAILIQKTLPFVVLSEEKSGDSRIISLKIKLYDQMLHFINIYAHSGREKTNDRDDLFKNELMYYLRNSLQNTLIGGIGIVSYLKEILHLMK